MLRTRWARTALAVFAIAATAWAQAPSSTPAEWKPVEDALQRSGSMQPGDVFKIGMPRSDLHVTVNGAAVQPGLALGSWVAFKKTGDKSLVMGDMVLAASEVPKVMSKLESSGISITALHNHLIGESPRVMYMHIMGQGDAATLAKSIHEALAMTGTPPAPKPAAGAKPDLDTGVIEQALGRKGKAAGTILQFSVPRAEQITDDGMEVPPAMGTATAINFQGTGGGRALTTGDFVLIASEVNPVIQALTSNGIEVTAVHNHMLNDQPHLFFLHFWGNDQATKLAQGLRAALDKVNTAKP